MSRIEEKKKQQLRAKKAAEKPVQAAPKPRKKSKVSAASKRRMTAGFTISAIVLAFCFYLIGSTIAMYVSSYQENQRISAEYDLAKEKGVELEQLLKRMQDPEYLKQYAREKYLLSKDGEILFMLPNE